MSKDGLLYRVGETMVDTGETYDELLDDQFAGYEAPDLTRVSDEDFLAVCMANITKNPNWLLMLAMPNVLNGREWMGRYQRAITKGIEPGMGAT